MAGDSLISAHPPGFKREVIRKTYNLVDIFKHRMNHSEFHKKNIEDEINREE